MNTLPNSVGATNQAILAALSQNWQVALTHNQTILLENPNDIDALNRITYAYIQMAEYKKARTYGLRVIALDKYNAIALKNLQKIKLRQSVKKKPDSSNMLYGKGSISPALFLEEPGRTKLVSLVNVAPKNILCTLSIGDHVSLVIKKRQIEARTGGKIYLGAFPDDLGFRLRRLVKYGNQYEAYIKSVGKNSIIVFIKEVKRSKRFRNQPTFPVTNEIAFPSFTTYPPFSISEEDRLSLTEDEDHEE